MTEIAVTTTDSDIDTGCSVCGNNGCRDCAEPDRRNTQRGTADILEDARQDLHAAVAAHDDPHRRTQYARSAQAYAVEVLHNPNATAREHTQAGYYLDETTGLLS